MWKYQIIIVKILLSKPVSNDYDPSDLQSQDCGIAIVGTKGYLSTANCEDSYIYVCSQKPNYAAPDYRVCQQV